ncbi:MAG: hypothetical protein LDLANPLL_00073 [Turneriella sp.]|nr:hypothetical protein [Turneriella sp.]
MPNFTLDTRLAADTLFVTDLTLSTVRLMNTALLPWLVLVPKVAGKKEIIDLEGFQEELLWKEISFVSRALKEEFNPTKLNVAALGNMVPQLHVHIVARFANDAAWPKPVWGNLPMEVYPEVEAGKMVARLIRMLKIPK